MGGNIILITAPGLDTKHNVSGVSSVTNFIIANNSSCTYKHFELGRKDDEKRNIIWFFKMIATAFRWMFTVSSKNIRLIHFNFALSKASIIRDAPLVLFAKLIRKKLVIHLHGGDYLTKDVIPGWMKATLKKVFSGNTPVIVLSPVEQEIIERLYKTKNIQVLPNCVEVKEAKAFVRNYDTEINCNLLFIGRISRAKGIAYIYNALEELKNKKVRFRFFMAGAGQDEKEFVEKFTALLGGDFEFKGVVSGSTKTTLYKNCNVFLLPSLFEGLPMSLLEAMSFGLIPVVTGVGSMKYVVTNEQNGIIVDQDPAAETAAAIERFSTNTMLMQQLSKNAAEYIFKNYSPEDYIAKLNKIYEVA